MNDNAGLWDGWGFMSQGELAAHSSQPGLWYELRITIPLLVLLGEHRWEGRMEGASCFYSWL